MWFYLRFLFVTSPILSFTLFTGSVPASKTWGNEKPQNQKMLGWHVSISGNGECEFYFKMD